MRREEFPVGQADIIFRVTGQPRQCPQDSLEDGKPELYRIRSVEKTE